MTTELAKIQLRRDTAANWISADPILSSGEFGFETDTQRFKLGDGSTAWTDLSYEVALFPSGTRASPNAITAISGIGIAGALREFQFVEGNGGPVTVSANPQVEAGSLVGQELVLKGTDDTNTVTIANGTGLELNGPCVLREGSSMWLVWDGTVWGEVSRNDI